MPTLEVCVDSIESVRQAVRGGADRLEVCSALSEGGLTPSLGLLQEAQKEAAIPLFAMVRPRSGDFIYSESELLVMEKDIASMKNFGASGFVFGCLTEEGDVDEDHCRRLLAVAAPLSCTFHRAFDHTGDPESALWAVIRLGGFHRLLTSGHAPTAPQGAALIAKLVNQAGGLVSVMPGGGITAGNVASLVQSTGVQEVHASASSARTSIRTPPQGVAMGAASNEHTWLQCDADKVRAIKNALEG